MVKGLTIKKFIFLITAVITLVLFFVIRGNVNADIRSLKDQHIAERWSEDGGVGHISAFFSENAFVDTNVIKQFEYDLANLLANESITVPQDTPNARLFMSCFSANGRLTLKSAQGSVNLNAVAVGGDFFEFHPLKLLSGNYFTEGDLNKDYCILDESAAWKLFGSNDICGKTVYYGDIPLIVRGVIEQSDSKLHMAAGAETDLCYVSYSFFDSDNGMLPYAGFDAITSYEIVMPNPVPGYAMEKFKTKLGVGDTDVVIVENSDRFSMLRRWDNLRNFYSRSMVTRDISYPWWENVARSIEDKVTILTLIFLILAAYSIVTVLILIIVLIVQNKFLIQAVFREIVKGISGLFAKRGGREEKNEKNEY